MKKTFKQIRNFNNTVSGLFDQDENLLKTKFGYAVKRVVSDFSSILDEYNTELEVIRINNALEDPITKAVILSPKESSRPYAYSKEGLVKSMKEEKELLSTWDAKEFEIKQFLAPKGSLPELAEDEIEKLKGFVIEEK